jgi:general secretion pathway protein K
MSLHRQKGAALIMAMLVMALATVAATLMLTRMDDWIQTVSSRHDYAQARELAKGGINFGRTILLDDARNSTLDHGEETWAQRLPALATEGGELEGNIVDEQSRFNLNNLLDGRQIDEAALEDYRRLLVLLGLDPLLAETLADWLDADEIARAGGAESAYYQTLPEPHVAANQSLERLDDLRRIKGYAAPVIRQLAEYVTVLPGKREVNVNTASPRLLTALLPGLSLSEAQNLVTTRQGAWFTSGADFRNRLPRSDLPSNDTPFSASSNFFSIKASAHFGLAEVRMNALVERAAGSSLPRILWQSEQ